MANIEKMIALLNADPQIHKAEDWGDYYKVFTLYLLGISNDYLNVYLINEGKGEWSLSDSNSVYAVLDDFYAVNERMLQNAAKEVGLEFMDYRFISFPVDENNVISEVHKYGKLIPLLTKRRH